ncbi:malonic semialdehyde reductase [Oceanibaculum pacificum]|uniref:Putative NADH dehydrogenase/NAD(P)H nitroreductase AUP43_09600 n=1 Tax=Oceanibaculum pacificum TaxID=580166 RepID=A0A154W2R4_9PROT|nr:malonic semialdehyde reductase [Oceanibaculum pacificum]KZD07865.1 hypothetical protein AUP43_09600 [Oceanibaculum pacificum]
MTAPLTDDALDLIFREARTYNSFKPDPIDPALLRRIYDLAKMGPTAANSLPARIVFVVSPEAKEKLRPALSAANVDKTLAAPAVAIFAYDLEFYEKLPKTFPHTDARSWFVGKPAHIETTAFRNATLQAAYFMIAARSLGLDCGPMSGFDNATVDAAFFAGTAWKSNFLCNLGHGTTDRLFGRLPRLDFDEACRID